MVHNIHINNALDLFDINCSIHCNALYEGNFSRNKCQIIQVEAQSCSKSRPCYVLPCIGIAKNCKGSEFITVTLQSGQSEDKVHFAHSKQRNKLESQIFSIYLVVYWEVALQLQKEIWRGNENCVVPETSWLLTSFRRVNLSICM